MERYIYTIVRRSLAFEGFCTYLEVAVISMLLSLLLFDSLSLTKVVLHKFEVPKMLF